MSIDELETYKEFMCQYNEHHYCCPKCHKHRYSSTLMGYVFDCTHPENYVDRNHIVCGECGWEGINMN